MWPAKLLYLLLAVTALLFALLYLPEFSVYLLLTMLIIPLVLFFTVRWSRAHLNAKLCVSSDPVQPRKPFLCTVILQSRTRLPIGSAAVTLCAVHTITSDTVISQQQTCIPAKGTVRLAFTVTPVHCGQVHIKISRIRVFDWLRLCSRSVASSASCQVTVLPQVPAPPEFNTPQGQAAGEVYLQPAAEPEEFIGVRNYREGDRMRAIHWKLSGKFPEPIVREFGAPIEKPVTVALIYACNPEIADPATQVDAMLEAITALIAVICQSGQTVQLLICSAQSCTKTTICKTGQLVTPLCEMLETPPSKDAAVCLENLTALGVPDVSYCITQTDYNATLLVYDPDDKSEMHFPISAGTAAKTVYRLFKGTASGGGHI